MSGGHFDYQQYQLTEIADKIDRAINANCKMGSLQSAILRHEGKTRYSDATIKRFHEASATLKRSEARCSVSIDC